MLGVAKPPTHLPEGSVNRHKLARLTPTGRLQMVRRLEAGERGRDVAAALGLSTTTVWRWWRRYRQEGEAGLVDRSSRPRRSPRATPHYRRRQITKRRRAGWSSLRIARDLQMPVATVVQVQRRLGLQRVPRPAPPPVVRYERAEAGDLVHLDIKKLGRIGRVGHRIHGDRQRRSRAVGWEYLHVAVDDHSRASYTALFPDETAASCVAFLRQARAWFARQGVTIQRILTDNGPGYRSQAMRQQVRALGIAHRWTRPYRPQTNGKAERFIRTSLQEWAYARPYHHSTWRARALRDFQRYYNYERPHMGIHGQTPMQRLRASVNNVFINNI